MENAAETHWGETPRRNAYGVPCARAKKKDCTMKRSALERRGVSRGHTTPRRHDGAGSLIFTSVRLTSPPAEEETPLISASLNLSFFPSSSLKVNAEKKFIYY